MTLGGRSSIRSTLRRWMVGLGLLALSAFLVGLFGRLALAQGWFTYIDTLINVGEPAEPTIDSARRLSLATTARNVATASVLLCLLLLLLRRSGEGLVFLGSGFTAVIAQNLLSEWVNRIPTAATDLAPPGSFPSSHVFYAVAVYGLFAAFFSRSMSSFKWKAVTALLALTLIVLTAYARLLEGPQQLSDVLFGLLLGAVWLTTALWVTRRPEKEAGGLRFRR